MDIALCRINAEDRTVEYAGAHRPLYFMKGGVMNEVKGNKFPIGGGIYKNQTNFTTTKLQLAKGDSCYFSSDGFPDQFGAQKSVNLDQRRRGRLLNRSIKNQCKRPSKFLIANGTLGKAIINKQMTYF
jgi:serine phosphatase RsbU (regulator of sigma subunit)